MGPAASVAAWAWAARVTAAWDGTWSEGAPHADHGTIVLRLLNDARAQKHTITLTPHDVGRLLAITNAWNEDRVRRNAGPPLAPTAVLARVLDTMATLVAGKGA